MKMVLCYKLKFEDPSGIQSPTYQQQQLSKDNSHFECILSKQMKKNGKCSETHDNIWNTLSNFKLLIKTKVCSVRHGNSLLLNLKSCK